MDNFQTDEMLTKEYSHFISLGYFCSVAMELESLGLRNESSPFDWCMTHDFNGVLNAIRNNFSHLLDYEVLAQAKKSLNHYRSLTYNIDFFHDFDQYHSLEEQLPAVKEKYDRRIARFYNSISEPTLFIRYISDQRNSSDGKSEELKWIENNYTEIINLLRSFNEQNELLLIGNDGVDSQKLRVFNVSKDENDVVARAPLHKNRQLFEIFEAFKYDEREKNLEWYNKKQKKKEKFFNKLKKKISNKFRALFLREYIHEKQY